jgi:hypothetical protein
VLFKKYNGRGTVTFVTLANEKPAFLENISTKDDAARRYFSIMTKDGAPRKTLDYKLPKILFKLERSKIALVA